MKNTECTTLRGEKNAVHFLCTPKNLDVPPKMKVKGYMYPQMKKPVGMLLLALWTSILKKLVSNPD
jgi:hypothetical protein